MKPPIPTMGPKVAGVIGSHVAPGLFLTMLGWEPTWRFGKAPSP